MLHLQTHNYKQTNKPWAKSTSKGIMLIIPVNSNVTVTDRSSANWIGLLVYLLFWAINWVVPCILIRMKIFCKRTVVYGQLRENFLSPLPHFIDIISMLKCTYSRESQKLSLSSIITSSEKWSTGPFHNSKTTGLDGVSVCSSLMSFKNGFFEMLMGSK